MIELTCWGCGRVGRAPDRFERRLAACKRCRAVNLVPGRPTRVPRPLGRAAAVDRAPSGVAN